MCQNFPTILNFGKLASHDDKTMGNIILSLEMHININGIHGNIWCRGELMACLGPSADIHI